MLKIKRHPYLYLLVYTGILAVISYGFINLGDRQHDYAYHVARMVGLAQSIAHGDWLPNLNFVFASGIGFASPMFYGNWQFYLPALLFILTKNASLSYTFFIFLVFLLTAFSSYYTVEKMTQDKVRALTAGMLMPLFYTWLGYGMTMTVMLVPLLLYALYKVLYLDKRNPLLLGVVIALLVQTHILSTLVLAITSFVFVLFNAKLLTLKKVVSFLYSLGLSLLLSLGFIFQYLEQVKSQTFFVSWTLRDFPFPTETLATASGFLTNLVNYDKPFIILLIIYLSIYQYKSLSQLSKTLLMTIITLFVLQSDIFPWNGFLRYTFLATLQDSRRLVFFVPSLLVILLALSLQTRMLKRVFFIQLAIYLLLSLNYLPFGNHRAEIRNTNHLARVSFEDISKGGFDTSGDEYFNISINHETVRNGQLTEFDYNPDEIFISNVKKTYNRLEFDVTKSGTEKSAVIVLPLIWYKGYEASYSKGARGSQPAISYRSLTSDEMQLNQQQGKPALTTFALYDGRATIDVESSGHVTITYQKTNLQVLGYLLETGTFAVIIVFCVSQQLQKGRRDKNKKAITRETVN